MAAPFPGLVEHLEHSAEVIGSISLDDVTVRLIRSMSKSGRLRPPYHHKNCLCLSHPDRVLIPQGTATTCYMFLPTARCVPTVSPASPPPHTAPLVRGSWLRTPSPLVRAWLYTTCEATTSHRRCAYRNACTSLGTRTEHTCCTPRSCGQCFLTEPALALSKNKDQAIHRDLADDYAVNREVRNDAAICAEVNGTRPTCRHRGHSAAVWMKKRVSAFVLAKCRASQRRIRGTPT